MRNLHRIFALNCCAKQIGHIHKLYRYGFPRECEVVCRLLKTDVFLCVSASQYSNRTIILFANVSN